ncbi:unnamed protein product [Pararhodospirillum photometricum DSM 122]|uniref:Uncharacterized protein n=1 Tax=Pararhodospirillum photometricum DSM 122 TaxID=1150469 RepID=H6SS35_PARPM|nr:unnamed protein product [Pararhodospirillum photometricum DSM 122]
MTDIVQPDPGALGCLGQARDIDQSFMQTGRDIKTQAYGLE